MEGGRTSCERTLLARLLIAVENDVLKINEEIAAYERKTENLIITKL